jgi:hypothetical protein
VLVVLAWTSAGCDYVLGFHEIRDDAPLTDAVTTDAVAPHGPTNVMFVTSTASSPASWGSDVSGADKICAELAKSADLPDAATAGAYVAYLEVNGNPPSDRLGSARGWARADGKPFADTVDDLLAGTIYYPPSIDETGQAIGTNEYAGIGGNNDCSGYTSTGSNTYMNYGNPYYVAGAWQNVAFAQCSQNEHLYCFGITRANPLVVTKVSGRRAFVSVQSFMPQGGLAGADALCAADAQIAGLTGTFRALLPTTTVGAMSRFSLTGPNWVRVDGIPIANSTLAFESQEWDTALSVSPIGGYLDVPVFGADSLSVPAGFLSWTCDDWEDGSNTAIEGASSASDGDAINNGNTAGCSGLALYCMEP